MLIKKAIKITSKALIAWYMLLAWTVCASELYRVGSMENTYRETDTQDVEIGFNLLMSDILKPINEVSVITTYRDIDKLIKDIQDNKIDSSMIDTLDLLDHLDNFHPDDYYTFTVNDTPFHTYLIISNDNYSSIEELKNKHIAITKKTSIGKMFLDVTLLERAQETHTDYFDKVTYEVNTHTAIINLLFGKYDAILISRDGFDFANRLNPNIAKQIKILHTSDNYLASVITMSKQFPKERIDRIVEIALKLHKTEKGRFFLNAFYYKKFVQIRENDMEGVKTLRARYKELVKLHAQK